VTSAIQGLALEHKIGLVLLVQGEALDNLDNLINFGCYLGLIVFLGEAKRRDGKRKLKKKS